MAESSLSSASVVVTGLFHDLQLKRSIVPVVWDTIPRNAGFTGPVWLFT